jgi:flavin reductase (DIM6/NTAB) family NADH-FMN oxidoreductase RutF
MHSLDGTMKHGRVLWKIGEAIPPPLRFESSHSWLQSIVVPRPVAWLSVDDEHVALLNGYTAVCYTPPTLLFAGSSLPRKTITRLKETGKCTVSVATARDPSSALSKASALSNDQERLSYTFRELNLSPIKKRPDYPCVVEGSPVHMFCSLSEDHTFLASNCDGMLLLIGESIVVDGSVLSDPTESMKNRAITAKIDAGLIQPVVAVGPNEFRSLKEIRSLPRPQQQADGSWVSSGFQTIVPTGTRQEAYTPTRMEWNYQTDGHACALGFNPTLAFIMPRPIGWISTYSSSSRVPHLAPYSFFIDVAHGTENPMVAFSAYRPQDGASKKDAHKDSEETGCFCFNLCTEALAVAVNLSAAEMKRDESEFKLAGLPFEQASVVDAPFVLDASLHLECVYERTVDVGNFSVVIGRIVALSVNRNVIAADGRIDASQLRLISRLGYTDEYGIIS